MPNYNVFSNKELINVIVIEDDKVAEYEQVTGYVLEPAPKETLPPEDEI